MTLLQDWKFFALLSAVFAALTAIFGKVGVSQIDSNLATWYRTFVIFFILGIFLITRDTPFSQIYADKKSLIFLTISALCTGASWVTYYRALQLGPASKVAPIDKLSVALTVVMAVLFLGEQLTWKVALGTVFIVLGSLLMLL